MSTVNRFKLKRVGTAAAIPRGRAIWIPGPGVTQAYTGGGGEFGAQILDQDRTFAIIREPVAHRIVFTVAHDIFDNWFELVLEGDEKGGKSKEFDKWIQTELTRLEAKREFTLAAVYERAYGWAVTVLGYDDEAKTLRGALKNPKDLLEIKTYGPPQIGKVDVEKDDKNPRYGLPVMYHISRTGVGGKLLVHHSRVIHWATRRSYYQPNAGRPQWKGLSVLDPVWDDLVTLRNIRWGMGQTMYRYGSGFPVLTFEGATQEQLEDWTEAGKFENISARTYFAGTEKQTLEFAGAAGHELNPMNYYLPIMENISAGSGIPLAILRGVQAGALTGSEVNQQEYYGLVSDEQSAYEPMIRQLIDVVCQFAKPHSMELPAYTFEWQGGFELDEEKKARIESITVDTLLKKGQFMTRNELRKQLDPTLTDLPPDQGGEEVLGKVSAQSEGFDYHIREIPKSPRKLPAK